MSKKKIPEVRGLIEYENTIARENIHVKASIVDGELCLDTMGLQQDLSEATLISACGVVVLGKREHARIVKALEAALEGCDFYLRGEWTAGEEALALNIYNHAAKALGKEPW